MAKFFKRAAMGTLAAVMLSTSLASATAEMDNMVFAGYDTTNPYSPNKIYNEVINGKYTNKQVLVPVVPEWRFAGYETAYPHAGYSVMYLEGNKQSGIVAYNNLFPQWDTRRSDYEWEVKRPHYIWERQQTKINNKTWQWDFGCEDYRGNAKFNIPDSNLKTKTAKTAVKVSYNKLNYGFGYYNNNGEVLSLKEQEMYGKFYVGGAVSTWNNLVKPKAGDEAFSAKKLSDSELSSAIESGRLYNLPLLSVARLSATDDSNRYLVSDEDIAKSIPVVRSEYITAQLNNSGYGKETKNVAAEYLKNGDAWQWDYDKSFDIVYNASIAWSKPCYESAEPYNHYQFLIVNGVTLDGTNGKDRIYRYTQGIASPKVEWRFAFFQEKADEPGVYEVIEQKFLDGAEAIEKDGSKVYRIPAGEFGKTYFVTTDTKVQYWVKDNKGNKALLKEFDKYAGNLGGEIDSYDTASFHIDVTIPKQP